MPMFDRSGFGRFPFLPFFDDRFERFERFEPFERFEFRPFMFNRRRFF